MSWLLKTEELAIERTSEVYFAVAQCGTYRSLTRLEHGLTSEGFL